jgi:phosphoadenosine phosphosulfate reductase
MMRNLATVQSTDRSINDLRRRTVNVDVTEFVELSVEFFGYKVAMTTSFGIHSGVMLHLLTRVVPDIPVIWIDTGYLFSETYTYAEKLTRLLDLNLKVYQSNLSPARMEAIHGRLWAEKRKPALDRYHLIRKVEPLQRAFKELDAQAWFAGLRADQTDYRSTLDRIHSIDGRYRLLPILHWDEREVDKYLHDHKLPTHPLQAKGYVTVGDWHSSRPLSPGDKRGRETRFQGLKQECGLHLPLTPEAEESLKSSGL